MNQITKITKKNTKIKRNEMDWIYIYNFEHSLFSGFWSLKILKDSSFALNYKGKTSFHRGNL